MESEKAVRQGIEAVDISTEATEGMQRIHGSAEKIKDITALITEIADRTNLLFLNAFKESAAGKGFAVVTDEISKLAGNSTLSEKEISNLINETSANINSSYEMFNKINRHITMINGTLESSNSMSREINEVTVATEELSGCIFSSSRCWKSRAGTTDKKRAAFQPNKRECSFFMHFD
jgi:methyl-accepting chemotaxis protein